MLSENYISAISIVISILALSISLFNLFINFKKYKLDKSKLHAKLTNIGMNSSTAMFPSIENDNSLYFIHISIENSGYKEEVIKEIKFLIGNTNKKLELRKSIAPKNQEDFSFDFTRQDILKLKIISIIPLEDKPIIIRNRIVKSFQRIILKHLSELKNSNKDK